MCVGVTCADYSCHVRSQIPLTWDCDHLCMYFLLRSFNNFNQEMIDKLVAAKNVDSGMRVNYSCIFKRRPEISSDDDTPTV